MVTSSQEVIIAWMVPLFRVVAMALDLAGGFFIGCGIVAWSHGAPGIPALLSYGSLGLALLVMSAGPYLAAGVIERWIERRFPVRADI